MYWQCTMECPQVFSFLHPVTSNVNTCNSILLHFEAKLICKRGISVSVLITVLIMSILHAKQIQNSMLAYMAIIEKMKIISRHSLLPRHNCWVN